MVTVCKYTHRRQYSKASLNRQTMRVTLNGPFRELKYCYNGIAWAVVWDPNKAIDIVEWLICGGGQLET